MTYEEEMRRQYDILDQYNFLPYLNLYNDVDELMFHFGYECDNSILPEDFGGYVFNYCSVEDFIDYIKKRYPNYNIEPVTRYVIWEKKV